MEASLYFKTALILSIQLGIVFIGCFYFIKKLRSDAFRIYHFWAFGLKVKKIVEAS